MNQNSMKYSVGRSCISTILMIIWLLPMSACHAQTEPINPLTEKVENDPPIGTRVQLTLVGYNYTNKYIDSFSVNGQGGGNLFVSGGVNGGGKSACCVGYSTGAKKKIVEVRWQIGACTFNEKPGLDMFGRKNHQTYIFYRQVNVPVLITEPVHPRYFEVHFYPDGHIEAAITQHESPSRLLLNEDREDRSHYPKCPNDKKPEQ